MANLWDITNCDYKNRNKREMSWEEIAKALSLPKDEVSNKWNLLRQQFRNAYNKVQATKSGQALAERKAPNLFYNSLLFLKPILGMDSGVRTSSFILSEDSETSTSAIITQYDENYECSIPLTSPKSSPAKSTPKRRKMDETNVHRTTLIKQACEILANTKDDDEFEHWGKSVAAILRNFPDATAVRMARSKMNQIMASLEAGELNVISNPES
ncbi:hypothetical protein ACLKA6_001625 [Drosophila palustris]